MCLYDKRDHFPFSIVRMPYITSNMPSKIFYSSLGAEILRIGRTTNDFDQFKFSSKKITGRMIKQGAQHHKIQQCFRKIFGRHFDVFKPFAATCNEFLELLLN